MKKIILSLFLVTACFVGKAQTFPITQIQQACNHNGILVVNATGLTPPIIYNWYYGNYSKTDTSNAVTDTLKTYTGSYVVCSITSNGATYQSNGFSSPPFTYTYTVTNPMCPATLGSGTVTVTGGQAPYTVQWYNLNTLAVVATGQTVNSLPQGMYDIEITDANGCTFGGKEQSDSVYIMQQSPVQVSVATTTASCTNGTASVTTVTGGIAPYSYLWNTGQTTSSISNLVMGYYTATVTDAQGCKGSDDEYVPQSITINVNVVPTAATCIQNNGSAIAFGSGGQTPYSYIYSSGQTTQTATGLLGNNYYSVQVTDANGCIGSVGFSVNATTPISVTYSASPSSCTSPTGSATLSIVGGQTPYVIDWFTSPTQSGATVSNLISGTYQFKVTDANGCVQSGGAYIPPVSDLSAYPFATSAICPSNNGAAAVSAYSSYMPITYLWSNSATTSSINNLSVGSYNCIITDALGCQKFKTAYVDQISPIQLNFNTTDATCIFRNDGKINLTSTGGLTPYTYTWWNGPTTQNVTNLATNFYSVTVSDANGCSTTGGTYVGYNAANDSCYCTVTGEVFYDVNNNCIQDNGETGVQNMLIKNNNASTASNVNNYAFTDNTGIYAFILPTGSYNIQEVIQYLYPLSACQSNTNNLTLTAAHGCTYTVNFANTINPLHDVHLYNIDMNMPEPGQNYVQQVVVENDGTVAENNVQFGYAHDGQLSFVNSSGINLTQPNVSSAPNWYDNTNTVLNPGAWTTTQITYAVPTNIPMGTVVNFWDTTAYTAPMSNWLNDYTPWNNISAFDAVVVTSYDPNFIEVSPKGVGPLGLVSSTDTVFDYVIHFQNTGTAAANKIVVKDSIDANFNIESVKPGYSNHAYIASIDNHNLLTFTFNNINLPDMNNYPIGSIGVVAYSVHAKKNLAPGTQFKNTAAIYFDYNAPVITNTTINTINNNSEGINEIKSTDNSMSLFPNPTADNYSLKITTEEENVKAIVSVYSLEGSLVFENNVNLTKGANLLNYSAANFTAGLYIIRVTEGSRQHVTKLSVVK